MVMGCLKVLTICMVMEYMRQLTMHGHGVYEAVNCAWHGVYEAVNCSHGVYEAVNYAWSWSV